MDRVARVLSWPGLRSSLREAAEAAAVLGGIVAFGLAWAAAEGAADGRVIAVETQAGSPSSGLPAASVWLVDGYNALHAVLLGGCDRNGWWREAQRDRIVTRVAAFAGPAEELWVVFDGPGPARPAAAGRVEVAFAASADDWLLARIRAEADPARVAVVTADRKLADRARHRGAHAVAPRTFLAACCAGSD